jgi:uncharacterized protein
MLPTKQIEEIEIPSASLGNARKLQVIRYGKKNSGKKVYIQAGLHANEPPGFVLIHYLLKLLDEADKAKKITGEIILVPVANPIGISQWQDGRVQGRFEFFNGINFNRNYPELTAQVASMVKRKLQKDPKKNIELIRKAQLACLEKARPIIDEGDFLKNTLLSLAVDADVVIDLHCDDDANLHIYTGTPLWPDAADLTAQMGARVTLLAENSGGEPFDEACSKIWWELAEIFPDYPIPPSCMAATIELRGFTAVSHQLGKTDAANLFTFLKRRGYIKGRAPKLPRLLRDATPLSGVEQLKAKSAGVVIFRKEIGEVVKKGDIIADIVNPLEEDSSKRITWVRCQHGGVLFTKNVDRYAKPNRVIAKIAGKNPIKGRGKHLLTF